MNVKLNWRHVLINKVSQWFCQLYHVTCILVCKLYTVLFKNLLRPNVNFLASVNRPYLSRGIFMQVTNLCHVVKLIYSIYKRVIS